MDQFKPQRFAKLLEQHTFVIKNELTIDDIGIDIKIEDAVKVLLSLKKEDITALTKERYNRRKKFKIADECKNCFKNLLEDPQPRKHPKLGTICLCNACGLRAIKNGFCANGHIYHGRNQCECEITS